ncbi:MAG TPA: acyltransferase [Micromonosporaceae bacterium]
MRVLTATSVVLVHVVSNANPMQSVRANAISILLHYSREVFFVVSALVLAHAHYRQLRADGSLPGGAALRRRRIALIGWPYLVWSVLYAGLGLATAYSRHDLVRLPWTTLVGLAKGTDGYHMYFLLVSLEFTVVLPWFLKLLRATEGRHGRLLAASFAVQLVTWTWYHYVEQPDGGWRAVTGESSLLAYQFWLVLGGVVALHLDRVHRALVRYRWYVLGALILAATSLEAVYFRAVAGGASPEFAARTLQPATIPFAFAAAAAVYLLAVGVARIDRRWLRRLLSRGAFLSFGIYLVHPAVLTGLLRLVHAPRPHGGAAQAALLTGGLAIVTLVLAVVVAAVLNRSRFSPALVGRPRRDHR